MNKWQTICPLTLLAVIAALTPAGCSSPGVVASRKVVSDPNGNFHFYVTNQSFAISPVDIKVLIDGEMVVDGLFDVGSQHSEQEFVLRLPPGRHKIVAESKKGHARFEKTLEVDDKAWAALAYWFYPKPEGGAPACSPQFTLYVKKRPIYFF